MTDPFLRDELHITRDLDALHELYTGHERDAYYHDELRRLSTELSSIGCLGRVSISQEHSDADESSEITVPVKPQIEIGPKTAGWLGEKCIVEFEEVKTPNKQRFLWTDITGLQHRFADVLSKRGEEQKLRQRLVGRSQIHIGTLLDLSSHKSIRVEGGQDVFKVNGMAVYKDTPDGDWRSIMLRTEVDDLPAILFACLYPKNRENSFLNVLKRNGLR